VYYTSADQKDKCACALDIIFHHDAAGYQYAFKAIFLRPCKKRGFWP